jgi:hypothetical protein
MIVVLARYSTALTCVCVRRVTAPVGVDITFQISPDRCHWKKDVTRGDRRGLNTYVTTTITVHTRATTGNF